MRYFVAKLLLLGLWANAASAEKLSGPKDILHDISLSFSDIPYAAKADDIEVDLSQLSYAYCETLWNCRFQDNDGITHHFGGEEGRLSSKTMSVYDDPQKAIRAFGIGTVREKNAVLEKISHFLSGAPHTCAETFTIMAGGRLGPMNGTQCLWSFSNGTVSATFNIDAHLTILVFGSN